jgi:nitroreductase
MKYSLSEITGLIAHRRTIYPEMFSGRTVHREQIEQMLNAARWAPTHGNTQPWRFKVYTDDARKLLSQNLGDIYRELNSGELFQEKKFEMIMNRALKSPVGIVVWMQRQPSEKIHEIEEIEAVACSIQNMSLVAAAYGLGFFWSTPGIIYHRKMNEFLGINEKDKCLGILYIGYPEKEWPKGQRKPIEYFTEWKSHI